MNKEIVAQRLANLGLDPSMCGFGYMIEALQILDENKLGLANIVETYVTTAERCGTTASRLERAIRHLIEAYYRENTDVPTLLRPSIHSGHLANGKFFYKILMLLKQDTGMFKDGTEWVILECSNDLYEVRVFTERSNVRVHCGKYDECINFVMGGGQHYAAV